MFKTEVRNALNIYYLPRIKRFDFANLSINLLS